MKNSLILVAFTNSVKIVDLNQKTSSELPNECAKIETRSLTENSVKANTEFGDSSSTHCQHIVMSNSKSVGNDTSFADFSQLEFSQVPAMGMEAPPELEDLIDLDVTPCSLTPELLTIPHNSDRLYEAVEIKLDNEDAMPKTGVPNACTQATSQKPTDGSTDTGSTSSDSSGSNIQNLVLSEVGSNGNPYGNSLCKTSSDEGCIGSNAQYEGNPFGCESPFVS